MFEKHLLKSDILGKDAKCHTATGVFQTFSKNQLPGLSASRTLVENR